MEHESLPKQEDRGKVSQVEDRVLKTAAQFFGEDLLPYVGIKGEIDRVAPTEHVHLVLPCVNNCDRVLDICVRCASAKRRRSGSYV